MPKEQNISQDLYNLLLTRDFDPETTDRQGQATTPNEGVVFSFDYVSGSGRNYGTAVLVITDDAELLLFFGDNLGKSMEDPDKTEWFEFLQQLKQFATRHNFHTFSPQNLNQLKHTMAGMAAIREGLFEGYYGTRRQSYMGEPQQARLVIRHDRDIAEGDARYRHIESIFIETAEGERFRLGFRNLSGARAMLEHVRQGGRPYDVRGVHISEMVQEIQLLSRFNRASARRVVEGTEHLVEAARAFYSQLRRDLGHMGHARGYTAYFENWQPADITESDTLVEDLRALFVEQRIDDRIEAALPVLAKVEKHMKEIAVFENWAANLSEGTWTLPETPEQQKKLRELMAKELPLGPDATNATEQLYDLVGDDELFDILGVAAKYDPDANAWEVPGVAERLEELGVEMPGEEATADQAAADAGAAAAAQPTANAAAPVGNVAPVPPTGAPAQPIAEADNISQFEQAGVAEGTDFFDRFGLPIMPDDDGKFQDMMRGIKRGTKKQARADRRERDAASRERARTAFGPSPADKLSIRKDQGVAEGKDISDMEMHKLNAKRFRKDLGLPDRDQPKRDRDTDMDIHRYNAERFRKDLGLDKKPGVAEGVDVFFNAGETANKKPVGKGTTVKNKITGIVGKAYSWSVVKGVPYLYVKGDDDRYQSPAKDWLVVDEQGVAEGGYNPLDDERREQSRMDAERRKFKRDELEAELGGEEQRAQQIMSGTWYIVIDGQVWRRGGQPVTFPGRDAARRAGQTIKNRTPERTVTITTRIPAVEAAACNHTMEGEMCPQHGLAECGMAEGRDDPMNYNAAITGSYYESQDTDLLARIKQLALLK